MEKNYDLCSGCDRRGRRMYTVLPAGVAKTGMFVRLVGGVFLLIDRVENRGGIRGEGMLGTAAEVLEPIWGNRRNA